MFLLLELLELQEICISLFWQLATLLNLGLQSLHQVVVVVLSDRPVVLAELGGRLSWLFFRLILEFELLRHFSDDVFVDLFHNLFRDLLQFAIDLINILPEIFLHHPV